VNRRGFLQGLGALIGGVAIQEAIPFGRVWSFPKEIKIVRSESQVDKMNQILKEVYGPEIRKWMAHQSRMMELFGSGVPIEVKTR